MPTMKKKQNAARPNEDDPDPDEMYQSLTGKNNKVSKKNRTTNIKMYAKVRAPPPVNDRAPRRDVPPSPRKTAAREDTNGKKKASGPFQRGRANRSIPVAAVPITKTRELGRATGVSVTTTTTASRPRGVAAEEAARAGSNSEAGSSEAASSSVYTHSSPRRQPNRLVSTERPAPPQDRSKTAATPAPQLTEGGIPTSQRHGHHHPPPPPPPPAVAVQDSRRSLAATQPHGVTGTEVARVVRQEDWLSMLIPDENYQSKGLAPFDTPPTDGAPVVDFSSNDFCTNFDNHNDSDSIIWDPNAEAVVSSFFPPATDAPQEATDPSHVSGDDACVARDEVDVKAPTTFKEMTREADEVRDGNEADPSDSEELLPLLAGMSSSEPNPPPSSEVPIFRSSQGGGGQPPMTTVLVCKVTTAGTAATTSRSASSSSSSTSSAGTSDESQASSKEEERQDPFEEDGISDMETEGVEEKHVPVLEAPAVVAATLSPSRVPPRPVRRVPAPAARVPSPEPHEDALLQRRLSFSSLKMMLDKHSSTTVRREVVELESLDYWLDDDDDDDVVADDAVLNDEDVDPDIFTDGREDTYSFIGADYSFGADRSLVSLLPM